jgi:AcrR family transcriptional regulator
MAGPTPRQLAREETLRRIKSLAWDQLAESGAGELSLRAIARELNLVSSAIYRYYSSRDELITALIIDAYNELADGLVEAGDGARRSAHRRWRDVCLALRGWAIAQPHRFSLIYGTAIPGYRAPQTTVQPAGRVVTAFCLPAVGATSGQPKVAARELSQQLSAVADALGVDIDNGDMLGLVGAFARMIGFISLEVSGAFVGAFEPADSLYAAIVDRECEQLGLTG